MTNSKKHHYIPRFYLKGFTDKEINFFIYDKHEKKIWKSNPGNSFAENHRNTGFAENKETGQVYRSDLAEQILSKFDCRSATALNEIRDSNPSDSILTVTRLYAIRFFIISTFWRSPANDHLVSKIIDSHSFKDLGFGIFDIESEQRNIEAEKILVNIDLWKKMYPILLPITSFADKFNILNIDNWKVYYKR